MEHRFVTLKPMRAGVSGFARIQPEAGGALAQLHLRGLKVKGIRAFWYRGGGETRELGEARVNALGEAALTAPLPAIAPDRPAALLVTSADDAPAPLMCGLCAHQSAGGLMDAKNALMALCERLKRTQASSMQAERKPEPPSAQAPRESPVPRRPRMVEATREIFLPAIDPSPYVLAQEPKDDPLSHDARTVASPEQQKSRPDENAEPTYIGKSDFPPVDHLPRLSWSRAFAPLQGYFDRLPPCAVLDLPGWRFVEAGEGLYIGRLAHDGRVTRVAYALRLDAPPKDGKPYQAMRGLDGLRYQVLWQQTEGG